MSQSNKPPQGGSTGRPPFAKQSTSTSTKKPSPRVGSPGPGHTGAGSSGSKSASASGPTGSTSDPPSLGSSAPGGSAGLKPATFGATPVAVVNPSSCASASGSSCPKAGQTPSNQPAPADSKPATNSGSTQSNSKPDPSGPATSKGTENDPKLVATVAQSGALNKATDPPDSTPASLQETSAASQSDQSPSSSSADSDYADYAAAWQPIPVPPLASDSAESSLGSMSSFSPGSVQSLQGRSRSRFRSISASRPSAYSRTAGTSLSTGGRPLGPFAFLQTTPQIIWAHHPLSFQFATILRAYLNRTGYNDGVPKIRRTIVHQSSGSRAGYPTGSSGRWNSAHSQGPQRRFAPPQPPSPFDMESSGSSSSMSFNRNMPAKFRQMMLHPAPPTPPIQNRGSFAGPNPVPFRPQRQPLPADAMQNGSGSSGGFIPGQLSGFIGPPSSTPQAASGHSDTFPTGSSGSKPTTSGSKPGAVSSPAAAVGSGGSSQASGQVNGPSAQNATAPGPNNEPSGAL